MPGTSGYTFPEPAAALPPAAPLPQVPPVPMPAAPPSAMPAFLRRLDPTGWRPTIAVALILVAVVGGGRLLDSVIPLPGGGKIAVSDTVSVDAPGGWVVVQQDTSGGQVLLQKADVAIEIVSASGYSDPSSLVEDGVTQLLEGDSSLEGIQAGDVQEVTGWPHPAAAIGYTAIASNAGVPLDGELIGLVDAGGSAVIFDAVAPQGDLGQFADEIKQMAKHVEFAQ